MVDLTSNEKGAVAEAEVATAALHLGFSVSRPIDERRRYDLIVDTGRYLARVQCKWGRLDDGVVKVGTRTSRHTPLAGYVSTTYSAHEIDGFAVFCPDTRECYRLPIERFAGQSYVHLRLAPAKNNQRCGVMMAESYRLGAIAQLGERVAGSHEVGGSSPPGSTARDPRTSGGLLRSGPVVVEDFVAHHDLQEPR